MFGCCCVNKKALKKEQQKVAADGEPNAEALNGTTKIDCPLKSPQKAASSVKSPTRNDKSNSSDDDNNLSGLIISDGLVGENDVELLPMIGSFGRQVT